MNKKLLVIGSVVAAVMGFSTSAMATDVNVTGPALDPAFVACAHATTDAKGCAVALNASLPSFGVSKGDVRDEDVTKISGLLAAKKYQAIADALNDRRGDFGFSSRKSISKDDVAKLDAAKGSSADLAKAVMVIKHANSK